MSRFPDELYALLAHGDDAHRRWLRETIESFWVAHRPPHTSPSELQDVVGQASAFSRDTEHIAKPPQALLFARTIVKLASALQSAMEERDHERAECDRLRKLASEERKKREALQEEVEILERSIRTRIDF